MSIKLDKKKLLDALVPDIHFHERAPRPGAVSVSRKGVYYDPPNIVLGSASGVTGPEARCIQTLRRWTRPASVKCRGRINLASAEAAQWVLGMEPEGGGTDFLGNQGWAFLCNLSNGTYSARSNDGVATESTSLAGQDWTTEREFKIDWTATYVRFYVDGALVAEHTTRIPNVPMFVYVETSVPSGVTTTTAVAVYLNYPTLEVT
jgi:hypothetical protein